jgi:F1F0 ATPase subunit 2
VTSRDREGNGVDVSVILAVVGLAVGILAGLVFFGGLWWTSHRLLSARRPAVLVAASLLARMLVVATTLILLARVDVVMFAGCVIGVVAGRMIVTRAGMNGRLPTPTGPRDASGARG